MSNQENENIAETRRKYDLPKFYYKPGEKIRNLLIVVAVSVLLFGVLYALFQSTDEYRYRRRKEKREYTEGFIIYGFISIVWIGGAVILHQREREKKTRRNEILEKMLEKEQEKHKAYLLTIEERMRRRRWRISVNLTLFLAISLLALFYIFEDYIGGRSSQGDFGFLQIVLLIFSGIFFVAFLGNLLAYKKFKKEKNNYLKTKQIPGYWEAKPFLMVKNLDQIGGIKEEE